jgi:hypothetical protein
MKNAVSMHNMAGILFLAMANFMIIVQEWIILTIGMVCKLAT